MYLLSFSTFTSEVASLSSPSRPQKSSEDLSELTEALEGITEGMSVYVSLKLETLQQGCLSYALVTQLGDLAETESSAQASAHSYPLHPWCILSLYTFFLSITPTLIINFLSIFPRNNI